MFILKYNFDPNQTLKIFLVIRNYTKTMPEPNFLICTFVKLVKLTVYTVNTLLFYTRKSKKIITIIHLSRHTII